MHETSTISFIPRAGVMSHSARLRFILLRGLDVTDRTGTLVGAWGYDDLPGISTKTVNVGGAAGAGVRGG